jgi:glycosyltransferase involved in cell wall biosynthesis
MAAENPGNNPSAMEVTLVVPVLNEETSLPRLLASIQSQTFPPAEIIFVDAGSADSTQTIIQHAARSDARIRLLVDSGATPGRGRNTGIAAAANDWIALTDAGIELASTWLEELVAAEKRKPDAGVVYGRFDPRIDSALAGYLALTYVPPVRTVEGGRMRDRSIASSLVRREVWEAAGRFPDLRAAEDRIFMERLQQMNVPTAWAPAACITWELPPTLGKVFRRFESYSMHNVIAGRQKDWHHGLAKIYLGALGIAAAAYFVHLGFWLLLVLLALARGVKSIVQRRDHHDILWCLRPDRIIAVCFLLLWIDLAAFTGWIHAVGRRSPRGSTTVVAGKIPPAALP